MEPRHLTAIKYNFGLVCFSFHKKKTFIITQSIYFSITLCNALTKMKFRYLDGVCGKEENTLNCIRLYIVYILMCSIHRKYNLWNEGQTWHITFMYRYVIRKPVDCSCILWKKKRREEITQLMDLFWWATYNSWTCV